ncbi:hypothetical protein KAU09_02235 [Candidatus Parcubacteria bacterium]|nr:hypothetical protein [Candidatus Parcubacteria bacterium]
MLTQKVSKKKNLIYGAVLGVILIVIAVLLFKDSVFIGDPGGENFFSIPKTDFLAQDRPIKKFDSGFLKDSRYKKLKDNSVDIKSMADLKIGKKNPFKAD